MGETTFSEWRKWNNERADRPIQKEFPSIDPAWFFASMGNLWIAVFKCLFRVYGKYFDRGNEVFAHGKDAS
jgi:hypothetical protein